MTERHDVGEETEGVEGEEGTSSSLADPLGEAELSTTVDSLGCRVAQHGIVG